MPLRLVKDLHERRAGRLVAELLTDLAVDSFQMPREIRNQAGVGLLVLDHEMRRGAGLHGIEHVEHFQRVLHAHVERIGVEGLLEHRAGIGLATHPHQEQAQPGVRLGLSWQEANRLAEIAFRGGMLVAGLQHLGQVLVELAGVGVPLGDFRRQGVEPRAGGLVRRAIEHQVASGDPRQRRFVDRIERQEFLAEQPQGLAGLIVEPGHVGCELPDRGQVGIDFPGPAERGLGLIELEVGHRQFGQGDVDLGRTGVDQQGRLELLGGIGPIVLLHEEQPGLEVGGPVVLIELHRRGEEVVHEEVELVAEPVPAGILGGRAADPAQRLGLLHVVAVIEVDQAAVMVLGLVQAARGAG